MPTENEKKLDAMLVKLEKDHPTEGKNFRALLDNTPELKSRMLEAVGKGNLEKFEPLAKADRDKGAVGAYNPQDKSIMLPMDFLAISDKNTKAANLLRSTFGHEIEHAVNRDSIKASQDKLVKDAVTIATGPSPHNYTSVVKNYVGDLRDREARDEIAGVNVLAAHIKRENPTATKEQLYEKLFNASPDMQLYFDAKGKAPNLTHEPKPGITFNDKLQIEATKENVEAFGKHFYDKNNYPKNYGQGVINLVGEVEKLVQAEAKAKDPSFKAPEVQINLKELGLDGKGVTLPAGVTEIKRNLELNPNPEPSQSGPRPQGAPEAHAPGHQHGHSHAHDHGSFDEMLNSLKDPSRLKEALQNLSHSPDGQQFRRDGQEQYQQLETQKAQEAARTQPTQETPVQEAPARRVGGM